MYAKHDQHEHFKISMKTSGMNYSVLSVKKIGSYTLFYPTLEN